MERFSGSLKREYTDPTQYDTRQKAKSAVIDYIEMLYYCPRRHSTFGYTSPIEFQGKANVV